MDQNEINRLIDECFEEAPQSSLERHLIEEYLRDKGYQLADLKSLPKKEAKRLMEEACRNASLKLAEVESRAHFRSEIRAPRKSSS
jgi:hypothetical protein